MRTAILNYLKSKKRELSPLTITDHLPWEDNNGALYHHNRKHLYVGLDEISQATAINVLDFGGCTDESTIVRAYFVSDAKNPLPNLDSLIQVIKEARLTPEIEGVIQRTCQVRHSYNSDDIVVEFEFSFTKLLTQ